MSKQRIAGSNGEQIIKTACQLGPSECGMNVYVRDGRITKIEGMSEHPYNKGRLCVRGKQAMEYAYHKDRIKYPMKKDVLVAGDAMRCV